MHLLRTIECNNYVRIDAMYRVFRVPFLFERYVILNAPNFKCPNDRLRNIVCNSSGKDGLECVFMRAADGTPYRKHTAHTHDELRSFRCMALLDRTYSRVR